MNAGRRLPNTPEPTRQWRGSDDLTLAGDAWGDPDAPLVVLLHGGGQTRHAWSGAGQRLAEVGYYAVAYDARGHGDSDWAKDGNYTQDANVADLVAILRDLGKPKPALVGASMGGGTSLVAVGERRVDAAALVLVDVAPHIEREGAAKISTFMDQNPDGFASLDEVADAIANYQPHRKRQRRLDGLAKNVRLGDDGRFHWHWDPQIRSRRMQFETREERLSECARSLTIPTLLVRGMLSDLLSEDGAQLFLELSPQSEYVSVAGAGHMVAGDRNDIFVNAVLDFLIRFDPQDGSALTTDASAQPRHVGPGDGVVDIP
jgi:non-heme chloroperoxidase